MSRPFSIGVAAIMAATAVPASAATVFNLGAATGETASPGSYSYNFNAGAGAGSLDFVIQGYRSIDGTPGSCCPDTLSVTLNSVLIFQGSYVLGGSGGNTTFVNTGVGTVTPVNNGLFQGGTLTFGNGAVTLLNGNNTITFAYSGAAQGIPDEAWGINSATITGNAFNVVPEPSAWALMILGFGAVGGALRWRRKLRTTLTYA